MNPGTFVFELVFGEKDGGQPLLLKLWDSDNPACGENCDSVIGYELYDKATRESLDGGEMDFNSAEKDYDSPKEAINDLVGYLWGTDTPPDYIRESDIDPDDLD